MRLRPNCEILLCGEEPGVREQAKNLGVKFVSDISRSPSGRPLLNSVFESAEANTDSEYLCYVNTDIILMSDFMDAAQLMCSLRRPFLMVGQRRNVFVKETLCFEDGWEGSLRERADKEGTFCPGVDFFLFPRGLWTDMPGFAVGCCHYDNWLPYSARCHGAIVVDATAVVTAVHQEHSVFERWKDPEFDMNWQLLEGQNVFTFAEATHLLTPQGLEMRCRSCFPICVCNPLDDNE